MKRWITQGLVVWLAMGGLAQAQSTIPRMPRTTVQEVNISKGTERIKDYEKVKAKAKAKHKVVVIVVSQEGVKRPNLAQDTQFALQRAATIGLPIYVDIKEAGKLSEKLAGEANGMRDAFPGMIVIDPDTEDVIATVGRQKDDAQWGKEIREAKKKAEDTSPAKKDNHAK